MNNRIIELEEVVRKLERREEALNKRIKKISFSRLLAFMTGFFTVFLVFFYLSTFYTAITIIISIAVQIALSYPHNKLLNSLQNLRVYISIKQSYIDRIRLDWGKIPLNANIYSGKNDFVGSDLNITGTQSLHQLIDLTTSEEGRELLLSWLVNLNPDYNEIIRRQNLVKELIPLSRFRDKLLLIAKIVSKRDLNIKGLINWLKLPADSERMRKIFIILGTFAPINLALILLGSLGIIPVIWPISTCIYLAIYFLNQKFVKETFDNAVFLKDELGKFSRLLLFLERYNYKNNNYLKELCSPFLEKKQSPSLEIKSVKRIISSLEFQKNPFIWFILILVIPLDYLSAYKLEKLKKSLSDILPEWLNRWSNLEALISLAAFAYLNPEYTFPALKSYNEKDYAEPGNSDIIIAEGLGHPLIKKTQKVSNDFILHKKGEIAILTGSNMSGKSTFLRTLGINFLLAYSGGPVNAKKFHIPLFRVFTCIKVNDSVIDGISYFYAEVKRLKLLLDQLKFNTDKPVFFLIDEIFKGTNNLERLIGSRSYIKAISGKNGLGCVSTHDLELVRLTDEIQGISNYHFREEVQHGKMLFDYILRKGPCPTTNALRIMKTEGLPVEE